MQRFLRENTKSINIKIFLNDKFDSINIENFWSSKLTIEKLKMQATYSEYILHTHTDIFKSHI